MGKALGKLWVSRKVTVLITGPTGTGKTSILHNLDLGEIKDRFTDETFGNLEALSGDGIQAVAWNMYGSRCPGGISGYYRNIDAVIYVVNDRGPQDNYIAIAKLGFHYFNQMGCTNAVIAVLVNQRNTGEGTPLTLKEIHSGLDLDQCSNIYKLFPVVATTGEGLDDVQDWLSSELGKKFTRQSFFGPGDQHVKKKEKTPFHSRLLYSFKGLFSRI
ncbi:ADP-ribosylation factor-like protein 1 [Ylistrum balloti]|uniref:ADP-ribosylation factor-like protein 1 n=1 Tax=Ylistrum balloti TaxID=509963 RepID=UPI002905BED7|nr:ADP-ribosylation factor-like protein 1 [Ylistrum balloti]